MPINSLLSGYEAQMSILQSRGAMGILTSKVAEMPIIANKMSEKKKIKLELIWHPPYKTEVIEVDKIESIYSIGYQVKIVTQKLDTKEYTRYLCDEVKFL